MELNTAFKLALFAAMAFAAHSSARTQELTKAQRDQLVAAAIRVTMDMSERTFEDLPCMVRVTATCVAQPPVHPKVKTSDDLEKLPQDERDEFYFRNNLVNKQFPQFDPFTTHSLPISIRIADAQGEEVIGHTPVDVLAFDTRHFGQVDPRSVKQRPRVRVRPDEPKTWILDLMPWIGELKPGKYTVSMRLHAFPQKWWESEPKEFEILELQPDVRNLIWAAMPQLAGKSKPPKQVDWLDRNADIAFLSKALPADAWSQLAFYVLLAHAADISQTGTLSPQILEAVPSSHKALADVMQYELMIQIHDERGASDIRERLSRERPDLVWHLDQADKGEGLVQRAKEAMGLSEDKK